ncbi:MAG: hypothetical protein ABIR79_03985 [Candidatus Binatia bacterium]
MLGLNRSGYDSVADAWDAARVGFYGRERDYLDAFLADLPTPSTKQSTIVDLGCGTGRPFAEHVLAILADLGFAPVLHEFMNEPTSGRDKGRYAIVARKR